MKTRRAAKKIPLFDLTVSPAARRQMASTLESGWLTSGPKVAAFELAMCQLLGVNYAAAVNSATNGLFLALKALDIGAGNQVITTPYTYVATVEAIMMTGATPVFVDIDPHSLNINVDGISSRINGRTAAIVPVDIAGYPCDYRPLRQVAREHAVPLVSDAAHAVGARYRNRTMAQLADAAVFSFYSTKNLTCGEGGLVASRLSRVVRRVKLLSRHGLSAGTYQRKLQARWDYDALEFGFKANMSDVHAAIGLGQLSTFAHDQAARTRLARKYRGHLAHLSEYVELPPEDEHIRHGWHLFIIKLHLPALTISRDRVIALMAEHGVECGVHYKPIFELSYYRRQLKLSKQMFPEAAQAGRRVLTLPLYPSLKTSDVDYVCRCLADILVKHRR